MRQPRTGDFCTMLCFFGPIRFPGQEASLVPSAGDRPTAIQEDELFSPNCFGIVHREDTKAQAEKQDEEQDAPAKDGRLLHHALFLWSNPLPRPGGFFGSLCWRPTYRNSRGRTVFPQALG